MELQKDYGKKLRTGAVISTLAISALGVSTKVSASETEVAVNEPATRVVAKDEVKPKVPTPPSLHLVAFYQSRYS